MSDRSRSGGSPTAMMYVGSLPRVRPLRPFRSRNRKPSTTIMRAVADGLSSASAANIGP
jgi:hypothetical protein